MADNNNPDKKPLNSIDAIAVALGGQDKVISHEELEAFLKKQVATGSLSPDQAAAIEKEFSKLDVDGKGVGGEALTKFFSDFKMTRSQFNEIMNASAMDETSRTILTEAFDLVDANDNGKIDKGEFYDFLLKKEAKNLLGNTWNDISSTDLASSGLDVNGDGAVDITELKEGPLHLSSKDAHKLLDKVDADKDGKVTADELNTFIEGNITSIKLNDSMRKFMQSAMSDGVLDKEERMALSLAMSGVSFQDIQKSGITGGKEVNEAIAAAVGGKKPQQVEQGLG